MLNISKGVNLTLDEQGRMQAEGLKSLPNDQAIEIRQLIKNNRAVIVEYLTLWNQAWALADYVDGGDATAPYEDRIKKLPELNRMMKRIQTIDRIKAEPKEPDRLKKIPGLPDDLFQAPAVWNRPKTWDIDTCPALCRRTNKCYGTTYFNHKPGKALDCQGGDCHWLK